MPDSELPVEQQNWFDKLLKRVMPNGTVMRRYLAGAFISGVIFGTVTIQLINEVDENADSGAKAICAVIVYSEEAADSASRSKTANPGAVKRLELLAREMRSTGVECPPNPANQ